MNWSSLAEFADMGGHAMYVWGSYLMALAALAWELALLHQRHRRACDEAREYHLYQGLGRDSAP
jgi:heme exporter protein D